MLFSVVDVGSNTVRLVTYEIKDGVYKSVFTDFRALGLISEITDGCLCESAVERLCQTLMTFKKKSPPNAEFFAFATAFMRVIANAKQVLDTVESKTGIKIEVLSERQEAIFSFNGVMRGLQKTDGIVSDFGGGSCEFIKFSNSKPEEFISLPFGCVMLNKKFVSGEGFPTLDEAKSIEEYVKKEVSKVGWLKECSDLILTGGTARAFAQLDNFLNKTSLPLANYSFTKASFYRLYDAFYSFDAKCTDFIKSSMSSRLKTIYPGFSGVKAIIDTIGCSSITISVDGVREGYLAEKIRS